MAEDDDLPLLREAWPKMASRLEEALTADGRECLAVSVSDLRVHDVCGCRESDCQSFYTSKRRGPWSEVGEYECVTLDRYPYANLDVVDGEIVFVEILGAKRDSHYVTLARAFRSGGA
jgi:hypothetical protein